MAEAIHEILGGKVQLFQRSGGKTWHARASVGREQFRRSTKTESLAQAKDVAEDWFLTLKGKEVRGELKRGKTFADAAERFMVEFKILTNGERSPHYVENHQRRLDLHLLPFFGDKPLTEITSAMIQDYRIMRVQQEYRGKTPSRSTLHQEIVVLRQTLKTAIRNQWLTALPDLTSPFRGSSKVSHRAWFTPDEYKRLYQATAERARNPLKERWRTSSEDLHDFVLFMANTGLRPDEVCRIEVRDVDIVQDGGPKGQNILHIAVRGKRGTGYAKSMPGAVQPFTRTRKRHNLQPNDLIFPKIKKDFFNKILDELNLKHDREGTPRTTYSLRHSYICFRLMEGADIYQIAKNCRTSVEMIEKYYASHIKDMLDASAINVRKGRAAAPRRP